MTDQEKKKLINDLLKALAKAMLYAIIKENKLDQIVKNKPSKSKKGHDTKTTCLIQHMVL